MPAIARRALARLAVALLALLPVACGPNDVQSPAALVGHYEGNIAYRDATLPMDLDVAMEGGRLVARATLPALLQRDLPLEDFAFRSPQVRFRLPMGGETWLFEGWFRRSIVSGTFSGGSLPASPNRNTLPHLGLKRVTRRPPAPYAADTVRFAGAAAPLAGTVLAPNDSGSQPAIVLLGGGERGTRAETLELADRFARAGFVALSYDARGQGASAGEPAATFADHERDAIAAMDFLRSRRGVSADRVGVAGLGRGAELAPRVATGTHAVFVIAISPPGAPLARGDARQGSPPEPPAADANSDPVAPWAMLAAPAFVLFGERDDANPAAAAAGIGAVLRVGRIPGSRVEMVARADHALLLRPRPGEPFDFPRFAPAALDTLLAWACARAELPPPAPRLVPAVR